MHGIQMCRRLRRRPSVAQARPNRVSSRSMIMGCVKHSTFAQATGWPSHRSAARSVSGESCNMRCFHCSLPTCVLNAPLRLCVELLGAMAFWKRSQPHILPMFIQFIYYFLLLMEWSPSPRYALGGNPQAISAYLIVLSVLVKNETFHDVGRVCKCK